VKRGKGNWGGNRNIKILLELDLFYTETWIKIMELETKKLLDVKKFFIDFV